MLGAIPNTQLKPLVIFGAGASYDLINPDDDYRNRFSEGSYRPPLANGIFGNNPFFQETQGLYPRLNGLIATVRARMRQGKSFEEIIDDIRNHPVEKIKFEEEIKDLKKYITRLFLDISNNNKNPGNNYDAFFQLLGAISENIMVVNFNYDTLAQKAIENFIGTPFDSINSYIEHQIKLIHLHGSVMWNNSSGSIKFGDTKSIGAEVVIPTINGKNFVCPQKHTALLERYISQEANVVIIIGWKGKENHFNKILDTMSSPPKRIVIVGGSEKANDEILKHTGLSKFSNAHKLYINGFSNLLSRYPDFSMDWKSEDSF